MRRWIAGASLCLALLSLPLAGAAQEDEAARANALYKAGKRIDALPLYEDLAKAFPKEQFYAERLADCLGAESVQLSDPDEIKKVRTQMRDEAKRAVELGDEAEYIKLMANSDPDAPLYGGIQGPGKALLAEAEKAFTAGDFTTAMAKYTAAYEADPQLYEAALFAGDTAYTQKDLKTAAFWFARAIAINPNRETAYRYWGDAILRNGNDPMAAEKSISMPSLPSHITVWRGREFSSGRSLKRRCSWRRRLTGLRDQWSTRRSRIPSISPLMPMQPTTKSIPEHRRG